MVVVVVVVVVVVEVVVVVVVVFVFVRMFGLVFVCALPCLVLSRRALLVLSCGVVSCLFKMNGKTECGERREGFGLGSGVR